MLWTGAIFGLSSFLFSCRFRFEINSFELELELELELDIRELQ